MATAEEIFDILGNQTRRMILEMLATSPCYTTEIADRLEIGQKAINEHLRIMQELGLIDLFILKQKRGSPRKYFKIKDNIRMELFVAPRVFDASIKTEEIDLDSIFERYPEYKEFYENIKFDSEIRIIGRLKENLDYLKNELTEIDNTKAFIERSISEIKGLILNTVEELNLNEKEKKVLLEIILKETFDPKDIANTLNLKIDEVIDSIRILREKGVL
ncbi:MAG TPA: ArsR family transcriptional regulator [Methanofastidiosum sp.]|jgi:ArsR family transcriptional regulator|nr:ArsR family transcriptional regulator [Methanofastidiosum sp.]HPA49489.1 ArsR family transcriptional regulator [Methanofastidiosum sp.]HQK62649.1 ArsR family transcriptional regulator [Methanofastidiosum sp.]HQM94182.1 ArsR family transcriptional regulator [Methanofastidiosum sp.]HQQ48802.1 ArsR family transcriptional regulator [Methanofastidiosum sp.]